jgi:hypothetical protein
LAAMYQSNKHLYNPFSSKYSLHYGKPDTILNEVILESLDILDFFTDSYSGYM